MLDELVKIVQKGEFKYEAFKEGLQEKGYYKYIRGGTECRLLECISYDIDASGIYRYGHKIITIVSEYMSRKYESEVAKDLGIGEEIRDIPVLIRQFYPNRKKGIINLIKSVLDRVFISLNGVRLNYEKIRMIIEKTCQTLRKGKLIEFIRINIDSIHYLDELTVLSFYLMLYSIFYREVISVYSTLRNVNIKYLKDTNEFIDAINRVLVSAAILNIINLLVGKLLKISRVETDDFLFYTILLEMSIYGTLVVFIKKIFGNNISKSQNGIISPYVLISVSFFISLILSTLDETFFIPFVYFYMDQNNKKSSFGRNGSKLTIKDLENSLLRYIALSFVFLQSPVRYKRLSIFLVMLSVTLLLATNQDNIIQYIVANLSLSIFFYLILLFLKDTDFKEVLSNFDSLTAFDYILTTLLLMSVVENPFFHDISEIIILLSVLESRIKFTKNNDLIGRYFLNVILEISKNISIW